MKCSTIKLIFFFIIFPLALFSQDIPNAGFEVWNGNAPDNWMSNNTGAVTQSDNAHSGNYSVQLQIQRDEFNILYGGKIDAGNDGMGFNYFLRPDYLGGYYKLNPDSTEVGDHLWADVWLYKDGGTTLVGHGQETFAQPDTGWKEFSVTIFYILPDNPDRCNIQIFIGLGGSQSDTTTRVLLVDDLHFHFANGVERISGIIPSKFELTQNYPNPFNPTTNIQFNLPQRSFVSLTVFSSLGEKIETLVSEELDAGTYNYDWTANSLPSDVYFYTLNAGDFIYTKKMLLLK